MEKFEPGIVVYHKANLHRGVILAKASEGDKWIVKWEDGTQLAHPGLELYAEQEGLAAKRRAQKSEKKRPTKPLSVSG